MILSTSRTRICAALAAAFVLVPATPALGALPQQSATFDLAATAPNPLVYGPGTGEQAGTSVAAAGDVNADGIEDMLIGAPLADASGRQDSGSAYLVYGRDALAAQTNLGLMGGGGVRIDGALAGDRLGSWVAPAGDADGDGRDDLLIGAPLADPSGRSNAGAAYVVTRAFLRSRIDLATLAGDGYRIDGAVAGDRVGSWVSGGADVNGDGRDDVVVSSSQADPAGRANAGSAWVVHGGGTVDLLTPGATGFRIDGGAADDGLAAAELVPDATGDGRADVLAGVPGADPAARTDAGSAWLIPGRGDAAPVDLAAPGAGARVDGAVAGDALGSFVGATADVTGDAEPELFAGAPGADPAGRSAAGSLYLLPGRSLAAATDLAADPATLRIDGAQAGAGFGTAASGGGDLNDDGRGDLVVGDPRSDLNGRVDNGGVYVLPGGSLGGTIDLAAPPAGVARGAGARSYDYSGTSVAWTGDVNGDGRDDLVSGAPRADYRRTDAGAGLVLLGYGAPSFTYPATVEATARVASSAAGPSAVRRTGTATYTISPALPAGMAIDRATGAITGTPNTLVDPPSTHTLTLTDFAGSVTRTVTLRVAPATGACANERPALSAGADLFTGSTGGDVIHAGAGADDVDARAGDDCVFGDQGDDTLTGADGADVLQGGTENDTVRAGAGNDRIIGEAGNDTLEGDVGDDTVYGGADHDTVRAGAGEDLLDGEGGNDTIDGESGGDTVIGGWDQDTLRGGEGDDVVTGGDAADFVAGDDGDDRVTGGAANDAVAGGAGGDYLAGDEGDDRVDGGDNADQVHGGAGVDELLGGGGDDGITADSENDFVDAGDGHDSVSAGLGRDSAHGGPGNDVLAGDDDDDDLFGDAGSDELRGGEHQDELRGGEGNDTVSGDAGQDLVDGELGDDVLTGGAGLDHLTGDAGDDQMAGEQGNDIVDGGAGEDTLGGGIGDDRLYGGAGDDTVAGGEGKDVIEESAGRDRVNGEGGNDSITIKRGGATVDAGAGNDKVVAFNGKRDTVACGAGRDTAYVDAGDKVKGCEKRVRAKPKAASAKRKKRKKSSRAGR